MNQKRKKNNIHDHKNQNKVEETYIFSQKEGKISNDQPFRSVISFKCVFSIFPSMGQYMYESRVDPQCMLQRTLQEIVCVYFFLFFSFLPSLKVIGYTPNATHFLLKKNSSFVVSSLNLPSRCCLNLLLKGMFPILFGKSMSNHLTFPSPYGKSMDNHLTFLNP